MSPPPPELPAELNLDGLIGPTHSYAGLSYGNLASQRNRSEASNPRDAALQGLRKMKLLADMGLPQGVLPPHERPDLAALRHVGFSGSDKQVLDAAHRLDPVLLAACSSASAMWVANAATVSASADCLDGRIHFTAANLIAQFHRSLEPPTTAAALAAIFRDERHFVHHPPLPAAAAMSDEGAANHIRLCPRYDQPGLEVFVFGRAALDAAVKSPRGFPARQTREASAAIARLHGLANDRTLLIHQSPNAIDAGAFHNDVVSVGNLNVLFCHSQAFADGSSNIRQIEEAYRRQTGGGLAIVEVAESQVPLADAVRSYLFNSQLVRCPDGTTAMIAPIECAEVESTRAFLAEQVGPGNPIGAVHFVDVRQSMRNGGGPACLRLRVAMTAAERAAMHTGVLLTDNLYQSLVAWVTRHYRDVLRPADLADPLLLDEGRTALDALSQLLGLGSIYPFQRANPIDRTYPLAVTPDE